MTNKKKESFAAAARQLGKILRESATRNMGLKALSLLLAVCMWCFVVSNDSSITRTKSITGVGVQVSGQTVLQRNSLAIKTDIAAKIGEVTVDVEVAQANYASVNSGNVDVELDLSNINRAGTQLVSLKAASAYGKVAAIWPTEVELTVEALDSRYVPVNVVLSGDVKSDYYYNAVRVNPSQITVSGPASEVQRVTEAVAYVDMTDRVSPFSRAAELMLLDETGATLSTGVLSRTSTSSTVTLDVYPTKTMPVSTQVADVFKGTVAEGYQITEITISPESVTVAAEQSILDGVETLKITPISVSGLKANYSARASVSSLTDFIDITPEQVYVTIKVEEEIISNIIDGVSLRYVNAGSDTSVSMSEREISVIVTGARSAVNELSAADIIATADLAGLGVGEHDVPIRVQLAEDNPDVTFELMPASVRVAIKRVDN